MILYGHRLFTRVMLLTSLIFLSTAQAQQDTHSIARMGTSSVGSTYYIIANGLGELLHKHADINVTVEPIGGSYANVFTMIAGKIDYSVTNSGAAYDAWHAVPPFTGRADIALIAQGQTSLRFILVRRSSNIRSLQDLNGKILIGARPALPEIAQISNALIKAAGLTNLRIVSTKDTKESLRHLVTGTVDGIILPGGLRLPALVQLFREGLVDLLDIDPETIEGMKAELPDYMFTQTLKAGHFESQAKDATVFGLNTYLVASSSVAEEQVYTVTRTLFENLEEFGALHAEARQWTLKNTFNDPKIPFHPGAIRYFRENNLWSAAAQQRQDELQKD